VHSVIETIASTSENLFSLCTPAAHSLSGIDDRGRFAGYAF